MFDQKKLDELLLKFADHQFGLDCGHAWFSHGGNRIEVSTEGGASVEHDVQPMLDDLTEILKKEGYPEYEVNHIGRHGFTLWTKDPLAIDRMNQEPPSRWNRFWSPDSTPILY
jgi:hypothetical protein